MREMNQDSYEYEMAQHAMTLLRVAIHRTLSSAPALGLKNAQIGRCLGLYFGPAGHQGHITRTTLAIMEMEGTVRQDPATKAWSLIGTPSEIEEESA